MKPLAYYQPHGASPHALCKTGTLTARSISLLVNFDARLEMDSYDVAVIGTGPGGQRAAIKAAKPGASVVAIESGSSIGGAAIHAGTIPGKNCVRQPFT